MKRIFATALCIAAITMAWAADQAKYVFYFIGDGMGIPQVMNAMLYNRIVLGDDPLLMTTFPVVSMATNNSANSDVTDSAAAGTALATGSKTKNGMLGMNADSLAVTSIAKTLHDNGYGVGLVTSVAIDDATPAAFYAHVPWRNMFREIGEQLAESGYEFAAGSSLRGTKNGKGEDNGLLGLFEKNNVAIASSLDSIDKQARRVMVLRSYTPRNNNDIGYTIDSIAGALTLPSLTEAAVEHLKRVSPDKFFLMVEGGNIDHAGHGNDGGTSVREIKNFNQALAWAYDFYLAHPDETLIVVTADHETGGMSVGCAATGYSAPVMAVAGQKVSKEIFNEYCKDILANRPDYTWEEMKQYLTDNLGLWTYAKLSEGETEQLRTMFEEIFEKRRGGAEHQTLYASFNGFANHVISVLNNKAGFGWTTPHHTGSPIPVYAIGVGAEKFTNFNDNTDLPKKILEATKVKE